MKLRNAGGITKNQFCGAGNKQGEISNSSFNFLDLKSNSFRTFKGISISKDSLHHHAHNASIHRLSRLPLSTQAQDKEIITYKNIAKTNQLDVDIATMVRRNYLKLLLAEANPDLRPLEDS